MVKIVKGKTVYVVPDGTTSYDRIVATCYVDVGIDTQTTHLPRRITNVGLG